MSRSRRPGPSGGSGAPPGLRVRRPTALLGVREGATSLNTLAPRETYAPFPYRALYPRSFFDLQLQFAQTVSALSGLTLAHTLLQYTNFYIRFGLGRAFDAAHPGWREYLAGLEVTTDRGEWTYHFYTTRAPVTAPPDVVATFGCFSYARLDRDGIRLHFSNAETDGRSPLGIDRRGHRLAELAALFGHVKRTVRPPVRVVGASWLYNLDAYRQLFPKSYVATAHVIHDRFQHMPLWGQFVNRFRAIKENMAEHLLDRVRRQSRLDILDGCFPFQVLSVEASAAEFFEYYGV